MRLFKALFFTAGPKYSGKKAFLVITLSSTVVMSLAILGYAVKFSTHHLQMREGADNLEAIVQTGYQKSQMMGVKFAPLPTGYLAEALDLDTDHVMKLSQFSLEEARERLLATHVIREVFLKKMKPNLLFVEYELREPWAYLADYTNTGIDAEGFLFPFAPFYSPRHLTSIYLGSHAPTDPWGGRMNERHLKLVHDLTQALAKEKIEKIDISHLEAETAGKREIVITLKDGIILRLAPKNCIQQLGYYSILRGNLLKEGGHAMIIDLRLPQLAFISDGVNPTP